MQHFCTFAPESEIKGMTLRTFTIDDAPIILSWIKDKTAFRKWSADRYSVYPPMPEDMLAQYESGVFDNNPSAFYCYESVGFKDIGTDSYLIDGEEWTGKEMEIGPGLTWAYLEK